jgi:hypothetical protein
MPLQVQWLSWVMVGFSSNTFSSYLTAIKQFWMVFFQKWSCYCWPIWRALGWLKQPTLLKFGAKVINSIIKGTSA